MSTVELKEAIEKLINQEVGEVVPGNLSPQTICGILEEMGFKRMYWECEGELAHKVWIYFNNGTVNIKYFSHWWTSTQKITLN